jgi:predicted nucleic acid-binding protein
MLDPRDPARPAVWSALQNIHERLTVAAPVISELAYLAGKRVGSRAEAEFLRRISDGAYDVAHPIRPDFARAADLVELYANFPLGTVDALLVAMAERLQVTTLLTLDRRHFAAVRPAHCEAFTLLP